MNDTARSRVQADNSQYFSAPQQQACNPELVYPLPSFTLDRLSAPQQQTYKSKLVFCPMLSSPHLVDLSADFFLKLTLIEMAGTIGV